MAWSTITTNPSSSLVARRVLLHLGPKFLWAAPIVVYELARMLFYILVEEREKLSLDQEPVLYTHFKIIT